MLQPGQMSLHHVKIFHGSRQNASNDRRIGFAIRFLPPHVEQRVAADSATLVRGEDRYGHFELEPAPAHDLAPDAVAYHRQVRDRRVAILMRVWRERRRRCSFLVNMIAPLTSSWSL